jgi:hypothetical protein
MSFREKSAWISFVLIATGSAIYFWNVIQVSLGRTKPGGQFHLFFGLVGALIALEVILHVVVALQAPGDARAPKDERDRLIQLKAARNAFYVLLPAAFGAIGTMHLGADVEDMAHTVLAGIVLAELVRFGSQIRLYRRDA